MTSIRRFQTKRRVPGVRGRRVVFVTFPGGQLLDVVGPLEVFDVANRLHESVGGVRPYELVLAGMKDRTTSVSGVTLLTRPLGRIRRVDTLVVGGGLNLSAKWPPTTTLRQLERLAGAASRIVSICAGAFVLGRLGLLDGRRCTTHWLRARRLQRSFPEAKVQDDAIFTEDGPVLTSAGVTAGIDLALHLVRSDLGAELALDVARALVVFMQRPGGQSQFAGTAGARATTDDRFAELLAFVHAEPAEDHRVDEMAARLGMSPRNFSRRFQRQTGETPAVYVTRARIEAAQRVLVHSDATVEQVAADCGFNSRDTFCRSFCRVTGVTPRDYRARFSVLR